MASKELPPHTADVLEVFARADIRDGLLWSAWNDSEVISFSANCSDIFHWGTADAEEILPEDIPLLQACLEDLESVDKAYWLAELFAARKRGMRPQGPVFDRYIKDEPHRRFFLDCGPERTDSPIYGHENQGEEF
jgi:hypothetical protein